jgi:hypothetical protein
MMEDNLGEACKKKNKRTIHTKFMVSATLVVFDIIQRRNIMLCSRILGTFTVMKTCTRKATGPSSSAYPASHYS